VSEIATLAGGCFWCLEAAFLQLRGVESVTSGYMGGSVEAPTYEQVCGGDTGHAEVVRIVFDAALIDYESLLDAFFTVHDPTTLNRQGNDVGSQYRSAIFWHDSGQRAAAEAAVARWATRFTDPVVTEIVPAATFWPAGAAHADYYARHPNQPYCLFVVAPKVARLRQLFAARLRD
jgi:peptide-methionine (S)-S-oxide reductase